MKEKKKKNFFRRFFGRIVSLANFLVIIWLGLCILAPYVHPAKVKYIALFSLSTPFAIVANLIFVFYWLILSGRKARLLFSLVAVICSYSVAKLVFAVNMEKNDLSKNERTIKVMTWNAHGLGIFNVPEDKTEEQRARAFIQQQDADILCLPEFPTPKSTIRTENAKKIIEENGYLDYRFQADNTLGKYTFLGTSVFSRYPIYNFKANKLTEYIYLLQADIKPPKADTLRCYFVHLNTFGLSEYDKAYLEEVRKNNEDIDFYRTGTFIGKFNYAFAKRANEADKAREIIAQSPHPVIICGDFNDLPGSYTYRTIRGDLKDAFLEKGFGLGRTFNMLAPTLRIDYILYDHNYLKCIGVASPYTSLSDHNPVIANFEIIHGSQG